MKSFCLFTLLAEPFIVSFCTWLWMALDRLLFWSKFTAKWQIEKMLAGFQCTWCARWCVALDHLGSCTGKDNSQDLATDKRYEKKKFGKWLAGASVYILLSIRVLKLKRRVWINVMCAGRSWSLWCFLESVVLDGTGSLLTSAKATSSSTWFFLTYAPRLNIESLNLFCMFLDFFLAFLVRF